MSDVARYYWCGMEAVLRSRASESIFFGAYFADRHKYSRDMRLATGGPGLEPILKSLKIRLSNAVEGADDHTKVLE
jgi:hypothetical protein